MMSDTELLDWMGRYGFGCHHDARTQKWVSMAGCRFASPRAALVAAVERVRALKCPEAAAVDKGAERSEATAFSVDPISSCTASSCAARAAQRGAGATTKQQD